MQIQQAEERVLLGEPLESIADAYRGDLLRSVGLAPDEAGERTFAQETRRFLSKLCRHLADRHPDDRRVSMALQDWVSQVEDYDAYDALLSTFDFEGKARVIRKGRLLFPGPLTTHWR